MLAISRGYPEINVKSLLTFSCMSFHTAPEAFTVNHKTDIKSTSICCNLSGFVYHTPMDYIEKLQVKRRRDKRIVAMCQKKPQAEVARHFGISQQRVAQIVERSKNGTGKGNGSSGGP
jgi:Mor transcription activator family